MEVIKAIALSKIYSNGDTYLKAVDDVTFSIEEQEFVAITGPSGCGKTTLLNMLGGLEKPTHGCVYINDVNIVDLSQEERTSFRRWHVGFVFQNYNLVPVLNVFENIVLPAKLIGREISEKEVYQLAGELGIENKMFEMPVHLSGGQQQRVAVARALYTKTTVMLSDEPTGNLDSKTGLDVIALMKRMCREYKQTAIVVTHDDKIAAMADRVIRMEDGKVADIS